MPGACDGSGAPTKHENSTRGCHIRVRGPLRFCAERLTSLVRTLELTNIEDYQPLQEVATFATLVATYETRFELILEPYESDTAEVPNPILHFTCLDAAIAIKPVFDRF